MKTHVVYLTLKGKSQIKKISQKYDVSDIQQFMKFRNEVNNYNYDLNLAIKDIFWSYYEEIKKIESKEVLRESFAEKNIKIKHNKYSYSYTFNFYEMLNKKIERLGFSANKGEILYRLIINIDFE